MKTQPLDDLEMHELLALIYPEHIQSDEDQYFELSQEVCESATVDLGDGFQVTLADLLGRVVMLTMPMASGLTERLSHCIGKVTIGDGKAQMMAVVRRDVVPNAPSSAAAVGGRLE